MSNHTPGPWIISDDDIVGQRYIARLADWHIVGAGSQYKDIDDMLTSERNANARLIAAAPDMLAALEEVLWEDSGLACIETVRDAIRKAKGEA